ncbi:hypothetical protein M758_9G025900 [Ceratodon purpureus]|uniref:Uncharacterized protein n=1 Tax=Ceratodon purpureus TaxID=3225 RepID=A0A8T0GTF5_CERPU|nr:hypothetical protein KC19_9G025400 [Ceratodon purpureus]KAG0605016.1 hypothetical protein M758_9G025900 [Ceratodon purpureus]
MCSVWVRQQCRCIDAPVSRLQDLDIGAQASPFLTITNFLTCTTCTALSFFVCRISSPARGVCPFFQQVRPDRSLQFQSKVCSFGAKFAVSVKSLQFRWRVSRIV